jgi:hypothetical protein
MYGNLDCKREKLKHNDYFQILMSPINDLYIWQRYLYLTSTTKFKYMCIFVYEYIDCEGRM